MLNNGLGSYEKAMQAAQRATAHSVEMVVPGWATAELVEAAVRSGRNDVAADALRRLAERTTPSGTDWARGVEARSRALLSEVTPPNASIASRSSVLAVPACV